MIEFELPPSVERPLELELDPVAVRATAPPDGAPPRLPDRIGFGGPDGAPILPQHVAADDQLAAFLARDADKYAYYYVHSSLSLRDDDPPFEAASVSIGLTVPDPDLPPSIAWSMQPSRVVDTTEVGKSWQLGPELGLFDVSLSLGNVSGKATGQRQQVFLEALGEQGSLPEWLFYRTSLRELRGSFRLVMVVRAARGARTHIGVTVRATVRTSHLLYYRYDELSPLVLSAELP